MDQYIIITQMLNALAARVGAIELKFQDNASKPGPQLQPQQSTQASFELESRLRDIEARIATFATRSEVESLKGTLPSMVPAPIAQQDIIDDDIIINQNVAALSSSETPAAPQQKKKIIRKKN